MASEYECRNCHFPITGQATLIKCDDPSCEWKLIICKPCSAKVGDGSQHAVIEARQHSMWHSRYIVVRLTEGSQTKGYEIGQVTTKEAIADLIKQDVSEHPTSEYLIVDKKKSQQTILRPESLQENPNGHE